MIRNGIYNLIATAIRAGLSLISFPLLIKIMGSHNYGVWALVSSVLNMLLIVEGGLPIAATVFVAGELLSKEKDGLSKSVSCVTVFMFLISTSIVIIVLLGAEPISYSFPTLSSNERQDFLGALKVGIFAVWFQLMQQVLIGIDHAFGNFKTPSILNSLQWIFLVPGWIFIASKGGNSLALAKWQMVVAFSSFLIHGLLFVRLVKKNNIRFLLDRKKVASILKYGSSSWAAVIGRSLYVRGDRIVVGAVLNPEGLGAYHVLQELSSSIVVFSSIIVQPLAAKIANSRIDCISLSKSIQSDIEKSTRYSIMFSVLLGSILYLLAPYIIINTLNCKVESSEFSYYLNCFRIAIVINTIVAANSVGYWILFGIKKVILSSKILIGFGLASLFTIFVGCHIEGLMGAVIGNFTYIGTILMSIYALRELLPNHFNVNFILRLCPLYLVFFAAVTIAHILPYY